MHFFKVHRHTCMPGAEWDQDSDPRPRARVWGLSSAAAHSVWALAKGRLSLAMPADGGALTRQDGMSRLSPPPLTRLSLAGGQAPGQGASCHWLATLMVPCSQGPPDWAQGALYLNTDLTCSMSSGPMPSPGSWSLCAAHHTSPMGAGREGRRAALQFLSSLKP